MYTFRPYSFTKYAWVDGDLLGLRMGKLGVVTGTMTDKYALHDQRHVSRLKQFLALWTREVPQRVSPGTDEYQKD